MLGKILKKENTLLSGELKLSYVSDEDVLNFIKKRIVPEIDSFTVNSCLGFWKGEEESTTTVTILVNESNSVEIRRKIQKIAQDYATTFHQKAVLVSVADVVTIFVQNE